MSADMDIARLNYQMTQLGLRTAPLTGDEMAALAAAQHRADAALGLWGDKASAPVPGERPADYRRRVLAAVQARAPQFKDKDFAGTPSNVLDFIEQKVYADAASAARDPSTVPPGQLRAVQERDAVGRLVTKFYGDMGVWFNTFTTPGARGNVNRMMANNAREKAR